MNSQQNGSTTTVVPLFKPEDTDLVLVPEGRYQVRFTKASRPYRMFGAWKLRLSFQITTMGEHFEKALHRYYHLKHADLKQNTIRTGPNSQFRREYRDLFGRPARWDKPSLNVFRGLLFDAHVKTVTQDSRQRPLSPANQYSVVNSLIRIAEGSL